MVKLYLLAKKAGGTFILRIEDTDQNRYVPGAEDYIVEALKWSGMQPDEGPGIGGEYGPYRQSERKDLYNGTFTYERGRWAFCIEIFQKPQPDDHASARDS